MGSEGKENRRAGAGTGAASGAGTGAAVGGAVGSAVPGIGTAIGTGVGAAVGAGVGALVGWKRGKTKDELIAKRKRAQKKALERMAAAANLASSMGRSAYSPANSSLMSMYGMNSPYAGAGQFQGNQGPGSVHFGDLNTGNDDVFSQGSKTSGRAEGGRRLGKRSTNRG